MSPALRLTPAPLALFALGAVLVLLRLARAAEPPPADVLAAAAGALAVSGAALAAALLARDDVAVAWRALGFVAAGLVATAAADAAAASVGGGLDALGRAVVLPGPLVLTGALLAIGTWLGGRAPRLDGLTPEAFIAAVASSEVAAEAALDALTGRPDGDALAAAAAVWLADPPAGPATHAEARARVAGLLDPLAVPAPDAVRARLPALLGAEPPGPARLALLRAARRAAAPALAPALRALRGAGAPEPDEAFLLATARAACGDEALMDELDELERAAGDDGVVAALRLLGAAARPGLERRLAAAEPAARRAAVVWLGGLGGLAFTPDRLEVALGDADPAVRAAALRSLARVDPARARRAAPRLAADPAPDVREAAADLART